MLVPSFGTPIFFGFLEMKKLELLEAEKKCKRIGLGRKKAWDG